MKIISWNVNGIRAILRKGFLSFGERHKPDILCIQESKAHPDDVPELTSQIATKSHLFWSFADRKGYSGVVTFAKKEETQQVSYGIGIRKFDDEGRFVISDHGNFILYNIYFPNGSQTELRHNFKQEFLKRLFYHMQRNLKKGRNLIIVGDYNTAYLDIDVFDPVLLSKASGFLPEERAWFREFLNLGFVDCYRYFYPKKKDVYTWWSYRENARLNNRGWRLDHILVSKNLENHLQSVDILSDEEGSDHAPIQLCLKI